VHKANIMKKGDGMFLKACKEVAARYPTVEYTEMIGMRSVLVGWLVVVESGTQRQGTRAAGAVWQRTAAAAFSTHARSTPTVPLTLPPY
jgi:hypothetical protein